jgi:hypothetical protein
MALLPFEDAVDETKQQRRLAQIEPASHYPPQFAPQEQETVTQSCAIQGLQALGWQRSLTVFFDG